MFERALGKARTSDGRVHTSVHDIAEENVNEYRKPITAADTEALREIGRKSVNDFTAEDIKKTRKWAYKFYQELGTKSPFFRAWFGDWRANDTKRVKTVSVPTIDIKEAALQYGNYHVNDTGWDVYAGRTLKGDTMHHSGGERVNVKSLNTIKSILEHAVLLDTVASQNNTKKKAENTAFMHKLYTPITYDGKRYLAVTTVEEYYDASQQRVAKRAYNLKSIKIESADGRLENNISTSPMSDADSTISVSQLYDLVKRLDKDFSTNGRASVVSTADGTPRVMYHGTNGGNFTVFDSTKSNKRVKLNALGDGYYFTETAEKASRYGDRVIDAYLDMKNPYRLYARDGGIRAQMAEDFNLDADSINRHDIQTILKQHGYDGVLLYHSKYDADSDFSTAVVFSPEQIKSASDNIGTFDRSNPDVRYDLAAKESAEDVQKYDISSKNAEYARKFSQRLDMWDGQTEGFAFVLGETPAYLAQLETGGKKIGKKQVRMDASKIKKVMHDHIEMTTDVIKQLPNLLNDPMLVLNSKTVSERLVLLGEVYANGKPVIMALELNPTTRAGTASYIDIVKVASAYTRSNTQNLINSSNIRFVNKNESRVNDWLSVNRLQLPLPSSQSDSANNSVSQDRQNVNSNDKNSKKYDLAEKQASGKKTQRELDTAKRLERESRSLLMLITVTCFTIS